MKSFGFNVELPRIAAEKMETEKDFVDLLDAFVSRRRHLCGSRVNVDHIHASKKGLVDSVTGLMVMVPGDFIVWNQTWDTFIVSPSNDDGEWSDDLMPRDLLTPIARRRIV